VANNYLDEIGIRRFNWLACSPDLNPIEHLWDQLQQRPVLPENLQGLRLTLEEKFEQIPQINLSNLNNSMPRRLNKVIRARGGHTRYYLSLKSSIKMGILIFQSLKKI
jgi:hypothetical protein